MNVNMIVGKRIKAYLKGIGMKQGFLAKKAGLSVKSLNQMINDKTKINIDALVNISNVLGVEAGYFLKSISENIGINNN